MTRERKVNPLGLPLVQARIGKIKDNIYGRNGDVGIRRRVVDSLAVMSANCFEEFQSGKKSKEGEWKDTVSRLSSKDMINSRV